MNQIGTHTYVLKGALTESSSISATSTSYLTITVNTPCPDTNLIPPAALKEMTTSVLVGSFVTQQVGDVKDQLSVDHGAASVTQFCGSRKYTISSVADDTSTTTALSASELSISGSGLISLKTDSATKVGIHSVTVTCSLSSHTLVTPVTLTFKITINPCILTKVQVQQPNSSNVLVNLKDFSYTLSSTNKVSLSLNTKQTPTCGYQNSNWVLASTGPTPEIFTKVDATGVYTVGPITDTSLAGTYIISIVSVKVRDVTFGNSPALATPSSFKLTINNPCAKTTVYSVDVAVIQI